MKINTTHLLIAGIAIGAYFLIKNKKEVAPTPSNPFPTGQTTITVLDPNLKEITVQVPIGNLC